MFCTKCGQANQAGAKFCTHCGATFNVTAENADIDAKPEPAEASIAQNKIDVPTPVVPEVAPKVAPKVAEEVVQAKVTPEAITPKAVTPEPAAPKVSASKPVAVDTPMPASSASLSDEQNTDSKKNLLLIIVAFIVIVLLAGGAWLYKRQQAPTTNADQAIASTSDTAEPATAPTTASAPLAEPATTAKTNAVPAAPVAPAAVDSMKASTPAAPIKSTAAPTQSATLSKIDTNNLVARLQREALPTSCKSGETKVRKQSNVSVKQSRAIAKRAYPQLCDSDTVKNARSKSMPVENAPIKVENKTVTQIYKERSKAECDSGIAGFVCREALRIKVCDRKWSSNPPSGQSVCFRQDN